MRLICPSCGAMHSLEGWANDVDAREALRIVAGLPRQVAGWALPYLSLFRPRARALSWKRARRLLEELKVLVEAAEISWDREVPRPNNAKAWAQAMERVVSHTPRELPLRNHNYLRTIAYKIANELDAEAERYREAEITRRRVEEFSEEEIRRNREKLRQLRKGIG